MKGLYNASCKDITVHTHRVSIIDRWTVSIVWPMVYMVWKISTLSTRNILSWILDVDIIQGSYNQKRHPKSYRTPISFYQHLSSLYDIGCRMSVNHVRRSLDLVYQLQYRMVPLKWLKLSNHIRDLGTFTIQ